MKTKYRIAVVGCGSMANTWVEYALRRGDAEIVAAVDLRMEAAQSMIHRHGLSCRAFTDAEEAIRGTSANLVFNCPVPAGHYAVAAAAMRLGCDVFTEKPLAATQAECAGLVRISKETGRTCAVMQNRRYHPHIRALRRLIASGVIGRPGYCGADFFLGPHFGGFRETMDSPLLLDMAVHTFDQARFLLGADPVTVYCHEFNPPGSWYAGNAAAICIFEMSDGTVFCYRGSWCAEGAPTSWEASWRITGEKGTAIWDGHEAPYAEIADSADPSAELLRAAVRVDCPPEETGSMFHYGCLDDMFSALNEGRKAETDCTDNIYTMAMVFAALESAKTGRKIDVKEWMKSYGGDH